jgi:SAM-dependent methyltransferase
MPIDRARTDDEVAAIVRDGYDTIADRYLATVRTADTNDPRSEWVGRFLDSVQPESRIIDIGCGPGVPTAAQLDAAGHRVVGVDISPRQVALAQSEVPGAAFVAADILDLRFDPGSFDAAIALFSLIHVPRGRYQELFARLHSWLVPGGVFLASLGRADTAGWLEEDFLGFDAATNWTNHYGPDEMLRLVRDGGFSIERDEMISGATPFGVETWLWVLARASV